MFRQSFCYYLHQVVSSRHDSRQYSNIILQTHGENRGTRIYMHVALQLQQLVVSCRSSQFSQKFALIKANCIRSAKLNTLFLALLMSTCTFCYSKCIVSIIRFLKINTKQFCQNTETFYLQSNCVPQERRRTNGDGAIAHAGTYAQWMRIKK